jgi:hypothetical protein
MGTVIFDKDISYGKTYRFQVKLLDVVALSSNVPIILI